MQNLHLVIFDFDGVIADSAEMYAEAYRKTYRHFGKEIPFSCIESFRKWYDSTWENNWRHVDETPLNLAIEKFMSCVCYDDVKPYDNIGPVLSCLGASADLVIASTTPSPVIRKFLKEHSLDAMVKNIYSPESGSDKKNILRQAVREHDGNSSHAAVVGDTPGDIRPAKELGCFSVASLYGWYNEERLLFEKPDAVVRAPHEIIPALKGFLGVPEA